MTPDDDDSRMRIVRWAPGHPDRAMVLRLLRGPDTGALEYAAPDDPSMLAATQDQGLRLDPVLSLDRDGRHVAAVAGLSSPGGGTMVLLGPPDARSHDATALLRELQVHAWRDGRTLLQALLMPHDRSTARTYRDAGFEYLTELIYCTRDVRLATPEYLELPNLSYLTYSNDQRDRFIAALDATYVGSLDCPGLTGVRETRDVLLGHRHAGIHDPDLWFLAVQGGKSMGVVLLNLTVDRTCLEVVYMGVVARERGKGLGSALLSLANDVARRRDIAFLTLAVDSTNTYARRLYDRWGFIENMRRRAWIARRPV